MAAALGAYFTLGPKLPHEHHVVVDLGALASDATSVELVWSSAASPSDEPALGTRQHFAKGAAPQRLSLPVKLPDGEWDVDITVEGEGGFETTRVQRRVNLAGGEVVLPVGPKLR